MAVKTSRRPQYASPPSSDAGATTGLRLWLRNEAGRKGVPLRSSFERWLAAIPDLRKLRRATDLNILIVDDANGRRFNRQFRQRDYATNVLSFPCEGVPGSPKNLLGDLVICAPVIAREARDQGKRLRDHYAHMSIHGTLHLLGYDHENDADAERMENLEQAILHSLGIADPYTAR